jgi:hypothetical protein
MRDSKKPAVSNFADYAGPLTETILLGNLALWNTASGNSSRVEWDAETLTPSDASLKQIVHRDYRDGYEV